MIETGNDGAGPVSAAGRAARSRQGALLDAEVRRLTHALAPFGVLRRDALARACGAPRWGAGHFQCALDAAVATGRVRRLPFDFYGAAPMLGSAREERR